MQTPKPKCSIISRQKHKEVGVFCGKFSVSANLNYSVLGGCRCDTGCMGSQGLATRVSKQSATYT